MKLTLILLTTVLLAQINDREAILKAREAESIRAQFLASLTDEQKRLNAQWTKVSDELSKLEEKMKLDCKSDIQYDPKKGYSCKKGEEKHEGK